MSAPTSVFIRQEENGRIEWEVAINLQMITSPADSSQ